MGKITKFLSSDLSPIFNEYKDDDSLPIYTLNFELTNIGYEYSRKLQTFEDMFGWIGGLFFLYMSLVTIMLIPFKLDEYVHKILHTSDAAQDLKLCSSKF